MELNAASRPSSSESGKYDSKTSTRNVAVREVALQVALGDRDYEIKGNGAKNGSSPDLHVPSRATYQKVQTNFLE